MQVPSTTTGGRATTRPITPADLADLVEYSFGDATTQWGRMRIEQDQHPAIYNWSYIELGVNARMHACMHHEASEVNPTVAIRN